MSKILVVEDEHDIVEVIQMGLEKEGYEVDTAYDGVEALEKIKLNKPDLIVLDIMLPKLDGYSVNLKLKENPKTESIPVIVITGRVHLKELLQIREEITVAAYLEKPFTLKLLVEKIKELLR
ncbi:unnamed protein product [marine sediment metagenome]|uniref:Response regulatory domain-containing protein n=1 Tax=marine sediment metagenome TaxID=412755 RepID=X1PHP8_9ZZZZ